MHDRAGIMGAMSSPSLAPPATPSAAAVVLEARHLFRFRASDGQQVPIVRDVDFVLREGEFATVMGP